MMRAHRSMRSSRMAVFMLAAAIAWLTGVRAPRAQTFGVAEFAGRGRATLKMTPLDGDDAAAPVEVYATMTFGTELSSFPEGLYIRTSFARPGPEQSRGVTTVLVVDLDRSGGRRSWEPDSVEVGVTPASESTGGPMRARLYEVVDGTSGFDARARAGQLDLEASVVTRTAAGFRLRGWLAFLDAGPDGIEDTNDDLAFDVELTLESVPTPEALVGQGSAPPSRPVGDVCDPGQCWVDAGYYDTFYGYGCGDAVVDDGSTSDGCGGESDVDDNGDYEDPGTACEGDDSSGYDDNGNPTGGSGDVACEGDDIEGDSSGGCEADDSGSGCEGTDAGGSGCGDSGCQGDAAPGATGQGAEEVGPPTAPLRRADLSWVGAVLMGLAMVVQRLSRP